MSITTETETETELTTTTEFANQDIVEEMQARAEEVKAEVAAMKVEYSWRLVRVDIPSRNVEERRQAVAAVRETNNDDTTDDEASITKQYNEIEKGRGETKEDTEDEEAEAWEGL
jgi:hypothetical protein